MAFLILFLIISTSCKKGTQAELYYSCFDLALEFANKANLPNSLHLICAEFSLRDKKRWLNYLRGIIQSVFVLTVIIFM